MYKSYYKINRYIFSIIHFIFTLLQTLEFFLYGNSITWYDSIS